MKRFSGTIFALPLNRVNVDTNLHKDKYISIQQTTASVLCTVAALKHFNLPFASACLLLLRMKFKS